MNTFIKRIVRAQAHDRNILGRKKEAGFTLIEMMIVMAIIALLGSFVTTKIIRRFDQAKVDATKIQIKQLLLVLDDFRRVCGFYPTTEQGLDALIKAPVGRECKNYDPEGFLSSKKVPGRCLEPRIHLYLKRQQSDHQIAGLRW